jgi:hypothetical protein
MMIVRFADPYKVCRTCGQWITGVDESGPRTGWTVPCHHSGSYDDVCPSWSPVDGCQCVQRYGERDHAVPPGPFPPGVKP